jgi:Ca2+-binding EF-hand superfamily protein
MRSIGTAVSEEEVDKVFDEIDSNGNNQVDIDEFIEWVMQPGSRVIVQDDGEVFNFDLRLALRPLFQVYDTNHNGSINKEEFKELHSILQGAIRAHHDRYHADINDVFWSSEVGAFEDAERVFVEADGDRDEQISFEEFVDWQREAIEKAAIPKQRFIGLISKMATLLESAHQVEEALGSRDENSKMRKDLRHITDKTNEAIAVISEELYVGDETDARRERSPWESLPPHICKQTLLRMHMRTPVPTYNVEEVHFSIFPCLPALENRQRLCRRHRWLAKVLRRVQYTNENKPAEVVTPSPKARSRGSLLHAGQAGRVACASTAKGKQKKVKAKTKTPTSPLSPRKEDVTETEQSAHDMLSNHDSGAFVDTDHFYVYEENDEGIYVWNPLRHGHEYEEAAAALTSEMHIFAAIVTQVNFGSQCSWASLGAALWMAIDLGLLSEAQVQKFNELMERFAVRVVGKSYSGVDHLSAELQQKLTEKFFETDFSFSPFEVMNMLSGAGLVDSNAAWEAYETTQVKEFKDFLES